MAARPVDRSAKSRAILRAAAHVFAEQGFAAATIDGIAERAGIAKGTVYQYFRSKQDLFFAVFDDYIASLETLARQNAERPAATASDRIRQGIQAALAGSADTRDMFPLVFEFWSASAAPDRRERLAAMFRDSYARFRELVSAWIAEGQKAGEFDRRVDAPSIAAVLVGALDGLFLQAWFDRGLDPVAAGDAFVAVVLRGLSARTREKP